MSTATKEVISTALAKNIDLRTATYVNAINKLHEFYTVAGLHWLSWLISLFLNHYTSLVYCKLERYSLILFMDGYTSWIFLSIYSGIINSWDKSILSTVLLD